MAYTRRHLATLYIASFSLSLNLSAFPTPYSGLLPSIMSLCWCVRSYRDVSMEGYRGGYLSALLTA